MLRRSDWAIGIYVVAAVVLAIAVAAAPDDSYTAFNVLALITFPTSVLMIGSSYFFIALSAFLPALAVDVVIVALWGAAALVQGIAVRETLPDLCPRKRCRAAAAGSGDDVAPRLGS